MYSFVDEAGFNVDKVFKAIEALGGHASITALAEMDLLYTAWLLHGSGYLLLIHQEYRINKDQPACEILSGWGFAKHDTNTIARCFA